MINKKKIELFLSHIYIYIYTFHAIFIYNISASYAFLKSYKFPSLHCHVLVNTDTFIHLFLKKVAL